MTVLDATWDTYVENRCLCHRDKLIIAYRPLVLRVAHKFARQVTSIEEDDLVSHGTLGLIRAIEHFRPGNGMQFETYAVASIRGLIRDEMRSQDWAPRSLRRRQKAVERAAADLELATGRPPADVELATSLGWTTNDLTSTQMSVERARTNSLDEMLSIDGSKEIRSADSDPQALSSATALLERVTAFLRDLPPQEQAVMALYYYERMTLAKVGVLLGIPESRASQVHTRVVTRLRQILEDEAAIVDERAETIRS